MDDREKELREMAKEALLQEARDEGFTEGLLDELRKNFDKMDELSQRPEATQFPELNSCILFDMIRRENERLLETMDIVCGDKGSPESLRYALVRARDRIADNDPSGAIAIIDEALS